MRWRPGRPIAPVLACALLVAGCAGPVPAPPAPAPSPAPVSTSAGPGTAPVATPPATPPAAPAPSPLVVIDPGHNGGRAQAAANARLVPDGRGGEKPCNTTGAQTADGYPEHAFTFAVAGRLAAALRARGVRVVLTRDSDDGVGPCVDARGHAGERAGADAVVSVHADGGPPAGEGFHVLYPSPPLTAAQGAPSRALADDVVASMRARGLRPAGYIGRDGLDPRADIAGLNLATVPSVLVECANLRDPDDAARARSADGQQRYAEALADALGRWLARPR